VKERLRETRSQHFHCTNYVPGKLYTEHRTSLQGKIGDIETEADNRERQHNEELPETIHLNVPTTKLKLWMKLLKSLKTKKSYNQK
jgi:hypothetical protein